MTGPARPWATRPVDLHGEGANLWARIRLEVYGVDQRQHGWSTRAELAAVGRWLDLHADSMLLEVGCGEGGPAQVLAATSGARVVGVDLDLSLIQLGAKCSASGRANDRVQLVAADASKPLCFRSGSFDAINCTDVLPHLESIDRVLSDWRRLLSGPTSRIVVIDPAVPGSGLTDAEVALRTGGARYELRSSAEFIAALARHDLELREQIDLTPEMLRIAAAWSSAVRRDYDALARVDGEDAVRHQLDFCRLILDVGATHRLSRIAYVVQPAGGR